MESVEVLEDRRLDDFYPDSGWSFGRFSVEESSTVVLPGFTSSFQDWDRLGGRQQQLWGEGRERRSQIGSETKFRTGRRKLKVGGRKAGTAKTERIPQRKSHDGSFVLAQKRASEGDDGRLQRRRKD